MKYRVPGFTLGTTSFLIPDYYIPAVRHIAALCDDISLLISEPGEKGDALITAQEVAEIARIADGEGVRFNIHLPTDSDFDTERGTENMVREIENIVDRVSPLAPHTWVLHIAYPCLSELNAYPDDDSVARTADALARIARFLPAPEQLALENLETFPLDFIDRWLEGTPYSRCFDIGHVWKDGHLPETLWPSWKSRVRICHLHGLAERDHRSLSNMPAERLDAILHPLWHDGFSGAVTLEVFKQDHFVTSHEAIMHSWKRYGRKKN